MDAREMELKQGAAADLLQQGPHVEVAESGTSAVSSDEERLAAGISTIGLQAKGPSGAQWRRLTREGGMEEGTWTAERPPGGAPSSGSTMGLQAAVHLGPLPWALMKEEEDSCGSAASQYFSCFILAIVHYVTEIISQKLALLPSIFKK
jgi:hypothetical protein